METGFLNYYAGLFLGLKWSNIYFVLRAYSIVVVHCIRIAGTGVRFALGPQLEDISIFSHVDIVCLVPIAQRIERSPPKAEIEVQFLVGTQDI